MKKLKRPAAIVLALTLVLALGTTAAFAAETVDNQTNHTYAAYQIFSGTQAAGDADGKLAVTGWGSGINGTAFLSALKAGSEFGAPNVFAAADSAIEVAEALADNQTYAEVFAALAHRHTTGTPVTIAANSHDEIELSAGYYLLVDTTGVTGGADAKNVSLLQVTQKGTVTIAQKYGVPTVEKKVRDINDSTDAEPTAWQDSADYDIGDSVPFQLTGTFPSNLDDYETYFYQFKDTLSAGLTYNGDAKVFLVNGESRTDITSYFDMTGAPSVIKCENIKAIAGVTAASRIVVEYTAVLNANAVHGSAGNPNTVSLEFSNNPNAGGENEKGETPIDTVIVFTYKVVVNKTDENRQPLTGAEFTLSKKLHDGTEKIINVEMSSEGTAFTFSGLDDGAYVLRETTVPAGYNKVAEIEFTVTADHSVTSNNPELTSLTGNISTGEITFTDNLADGSLSTTVVNKSGATLPETGGIGTTIFYVAGAVLVLVAGVILVSKKRMNTSKN